MSRLPFFWKGCSGFVTVGVSFIHLILKFTFEYPPNYMAFVFPNVFAFRRPNIRACSLQCAIQPLL
jgi:hypothetical protein